MRTIKVSIVYHYLAHYRKAVLEELCKPSDGSIEYSILAGENANVKSIKILKRNDNLQSDMTKVWRPLNNVWITTSILWQSGLIGKIMTSREDAYIFLGNMYFLSTWIAVLLLRLKGKRVFFWTHGLRSKEHGIKGMARLLFYSLADGLLLYGNRARSLLIESGMSPEKLHVIYNSLNFDEQMKIFRSVAPEVVMLKRNELALKNDEMVIVTSGRMTKEKKYELLVNALRNIVDSGVNCKLIFIGEGPEMESIKQCAREQKITDNIIFIGACYDELEIAKLIILSDVFVVPGDIGLSAIHALTYGKPVVTHDDFGTHKPEYEAIIENISGAFFKRDDVEDLSKKILEVVSWVNKETHKDCQKIVVEKYNPKSQKLFIESAISREFR